MADLEVRVPRTLVALADEGAMSRAAHLLHTSQPASSTQLAQAQTLNADTRDPAYRDDALAVRQRAGRPALLGPTVRTIDEFLGAVLSGQAVGLAPASAARYHARPGVSSVPVPDADPSVCSLSWRADRALAPPARALVDLVRAGLPLPHPTGERPQRSNP